MNTYSRLPVTFERGEGAWLWDTRGNKYLDALSGIAVCGLGHAHPAVSAALCAQADRLIHTSNLYGVALQERLADALTEAAGMDRAFFCNSGAESIEAAIKLARLYGHQRQIAQPAIVVAEKSFHGRTLATLSATGNRKVQAGFEPLVQGFIRVPYDDVEALHAVARNSPQVVAVLVEPIQGEGGINIPSDDYLREIRALCDRNGWLMMLDEIQTGMARTGRWFAYQHHHDLYPDVISVAKGLANGVPIGACLARGPAAGVFKPGTHGSTFGGNPLACTAALTTLDVVARDDLRGNAVRQGDAIRVGFRDALKDVAGVKDIRGAGMMIGIELDRPCGALVGQALEAGLLINVTADSTIRLVPPLVFTDADSRELVDRLSPIIRNFLAGAQLAA